MAAVLLFAPADQRSFIASVLNVDCQEESTKELAEVIHSRTSGNIFFSKQILEELRREGLLVFSRSTRQWEWHLDGVDLSDVLSENVLHSVVSKIRQAPFALQQALVTAAYTRSTIDVDLLYDLFITIVQ